MMEGISGSCQMVGFVLPEIRVYFVPTLYYFS
jgi:hypothetical protein